MRVRIFSGENNASSDEGMIEAVDSQVIVLRCGAHPLIFPIYSIRLIKPLG